MLLSMHIPKTAGTSFRMALQERLGDTMLLAYRGRVFSESDGLAARFEGRLLEELQPAQAQRLVEYCRRNGVECIHGHFTLSALHELFAEPRCITFLRDPVSRLVSAYNHMRVTMPDAAERTSFEAFVRMERTQNLYEQLGIVDFLEDVAFIGLTEQYARSLALLGHKFPQLSELAVEQANIVKEKRFTRRDIAPAFLEELRFLNAPDFEIYDAVEEWFEAECSAHGI